MKSLAKLNPTLVGLIQTLAVTVYCAVVAIFFYYTAGVTPDLPEGIVIFMILMLLVFPAGVTGFLVFGPPAYLALNKEIKRSLSVLGFTFLFSGLIILILMTVIALNLPAS